MYVYNTVYTCSKQIQYDVDEENRLHGVRFIGGCPGNTQAVARLCEGKTVDEVISLLKGINCRMGTSCADQLATALEKFKEKKQGA